MELRQDPQVEKKRVRPWAR
jgi:hypothetical protein